MAVMVLSSLVAGGWPGQPGQRTACFPGQPCYHPGDPGEPPKPEATGHPLGCPPGVQRPQCK